MEGGLSLRGGFAGFNVATVGFVSSRCSHGSRQAPLSLPASFWNKGLYRKALISERSCPEAPSIVSRGQRFVVKADMTASASTSPVAPLLPESPSGQLLAELLQSHPHLVTAAAEQQLENLAEAREAVTNQEQPSIVGSEVVLFKRIAELRTRELRKSLEDIMYALISQKFIEAGISLAPQMSSCPKNERVDTWPDQDKELELVHSVEAFELIREHLFLVLGGKGGGSPSIDQNAIAQISKLRMGRVYAASAVYGYFLRRVDRRFQLEKTVRNLPSELIEVEDSCVSDVDRDHQEDKRQSEIEEAEFTALVIRGKEKQDMEISEVRQKRRPSARLRAYVMSLDAETLQRYATVRSKESVSVIERHTEALFGKPEIQVTRKGTSAVVKDEAILLGFSGLRRLVLEAVAFGSFLWDVETYVDSLYHIVSH